jgi:hypothetical protein
MKPHTPAGSTPAKRLSSIRYRSKRKRLSIIRIINIVGLLTACGCVPQSNKAARTALYTHHRFTVRSSGTTQNELSEAVKDKLFRGFERWRAAKGQVGDTEVPDE